MYYRFQNRTFWLKGRYPSSSYESIRIIANIKHAFHLALVFSGILKNFWDQLGCNSSSAGFTLQWPEQLFKWTWRLPWCQPMPSLVNYIYIYRQVFIVVCEFTLTTDKRWRHLKVECFIGITQFKVSAWGVIYAMNIKCVVVGDG